MPTRFPSKVELERRRVIDRYLNIGLVTIIVQVNVEGVDLPEHLRSDERVLLNLSKKFNLDVFEVGPFMIEASLSFGGVRYHCQVPYHAILGCITDDGKSLTMFEVQSSPSDEPPEASTSDDGSEKTSTSIGKGGHLRLIK